VELYLHSPIRRRGVVLRLAQRQVCLNGAQYVSTGLYRLVLTHRRQASGVRMRGRRHCLEKLFLKYPLFTWGIPSAFSTATAVKWVHLTRDRLQWRAERLSAWRLKCLDLVHRPEFQIQENTTLSPVIEVSCF
jgi:hypothetical protein